MREERVNGHRVVFYDDIEDLPITQFHKYSKYLLVSSGVGDTISDIDSHISRIIGFLSVDVKKAEQELLNLRRCLYAVATEQDIHNKATLCLIKSVDGVDWGDFSDSGIDILYNKLGGESEKRLLELGGKIRDSIDEKLTEYFPGVFESTSEKNNVELLRRRALLQLDTMIRGNDHEKEISDITKRLYTAISPSSFEGKASAEIAFDKQFEDMCLVMSKEFGGGVKGFTTMEFYSAYERLVKESNQHKNKEKNRRK